MASRNVVCFLGIRKLMKANTEQLACWRRSDSRARRSDGRGELNCTPGKRGGGWGRTRGECESEGTSPFSIPPPFFFFSL